jgi:hypothetical protein
VKRSEIIPLPEYFDRYINLVPDTELTDAFHESLDQLQTVEARWGQRADWRPAPDRWSVKDIVQHIADTERILCYRTLLIARGDATTAPGFDQDLIAAGARAETRPLADIVQECVAVRRATMTLFASFDDAVLRRTGINWKYEISVLGMGFNIIGHQIHHFRLIDAQSGSSSNGAERK